MAYNLNNIRYLIAICCCKNKTNEVVMKQYQYKFLLYICYFSIFFLLCFHSIYGQDTFTQLQHNSIEKQTTKQHNLATQLSIQPNQTPNIIQEYSIIHDLRMAFEPYSTLDIQYKDILNAYNEALYMNKLDSSNINIRNNMPLYGYTDFLTLLDTLCCDIALPHTAINSFDLQDSTLALQQMQARLHTTIQQDIPKQQTAIQKQHTQKTYKVISMPIDIGLLAPKCLKKKFNITKDEKLRIDTLLYALAKECDFSIQYTHNSKQAINDNQSIALHIRNKPLDFVLRVLLNNIFYTIDSHRLVLSDISMQMFAINYISSTRMAQSNTDVLFTQEQQENYSMGYNSGFYNSIMPSYNTWQNMTPNTQIPYNQNQSGYLDNLSLRNQLRSQMNAANTRYGKSGTKVYSLDEINFWADIESKLHIMLDTKLGDRFMIDKGAGLIAVWTTKQKMQEVAQFLQNLEHKMNMQVAIDVEILSLTHFQTNNIGIDWQAIFSVLNPTQSNLNLTFGSGGAMLTLGNNNADLQSIFNLLRSYGDLRSLSNPKIMALNNQPAIISVGSILRYTQNLVYQSNNTNTTIQNTSTQYPSVFAGILLDITPSISEDSVILRINPSITKTKDPTMENAAQALSAPPNLSTNQLSSIVKLRDGERVVIGGLLSNVVSNTTQTIPKVGENKWLKHIFGKESNTHRSEELIIIITPHIIHPY